MMRTMYAAQVLFLTVFSLLSCEKQSELFPSQCNCTIDVMQLSKPSKVTYRVEAQDKATVSSISYQTSDGKVTVETPSLPFLVNVQLKKGESVSLTALGNPRSGSIILSYDVSTDDGGPEIFSSNVSRVWIMEEGNCQ